MWTKNGIKWFQGYIKCIVNNLNHEGLCYIGSHVKIVNCGKVYLKRNVIIRPFSRVYVETSKSEIYIGQDSEIGEMSTLSCFRKIIIGNGVLTGPHVFISDHNHEYRNPNTYIKNQGVYCNLDDKIIIGDGTWIGTNVVIVGNVHIGRNCVIGANAVVTNDIPDNSVAVGIPCKVIKRYNVLSHNWERL